MLQKKDVCRALTGFVNQQRCNLKFRGTIRGHLQIFWRIFKVDGDLLCTCFEGFLSVPFVQPVGPHTQVSDSAFQQQHPAKNLPELVDASFLCGSIQNLDS